MQFLADAMIIYCANIMRFQVNYSICLSPFHSLLVLKKGREYNLFPNNEMIDTTVIYAQEILNQELHLEGLVKYTLTTSRWIEIYFKGPR